MLAAMVSGEAGHLTITPAASAQCALYSLVSGGCADVGIRFPVPGLGLAPARAPPRAAARVLAATSAHHSFLVTPSLHFIRFDPQHTAANWCRFIQSENIEIISYDGVLRILLNCRLNSAHLRKGLTHQILSIDVIYSVFIVLYKLQSQ